MGRGVDLGMRERVLGAKAGPPRETVKRTLQFNLPPSFTYPNQNGCSCLHLCLLCDVSAITRCVLDAKVSRKQVEEDQRRSLGKTDWTVYNKWSFQARATLKYNNHTCFMRIMQLLLHSVILFLFIFSSQVPQTHVYTYSLYSTCSALFPFSHEVRASHRRPLNEAKEYLNHARCHCQKRSLHWVRARRRVGQAPCRAVLEPQAFSALLAWSWR